MRKTNKSCSPYFAALLALCLIAGASLAWASDAANADPVERARSCGVFSGTIDRVESAVREGGITRDDADRFLGVLIDVCEEGLPLAPFEDKLAEGLAKRVAPPLIVRALNNKLDDYRFAQQLLADPPDAPRPQLLVLLGEGLSKGVPRSVFEDVISVFNDQPASMLKNGLEMASLLSQVGFDYQLTRSILDAGFSAQSLSPQWRYFVRIVLMARKRGESDSNIASAAREVLTSGGSLRDVSSLLGFTSRDMTGQENSN